MAASRGTLNGPDWLDVTQAALNYEHINGQQIRVILEFRPGQKLSDMIVTAECYPKEWNSPDPRPLVSASVSARSQHFAGMEAIILKCLYDLDVALWAYGPPGSGKQRERASGAT